MKLCICQETCKHYTNGTKRRVHHMRISELYVHWNGEYCTDKIVGVKEGDACNIEKIRRIKGGMK